MKYKILLPLLLVLISTSIFLFGELKKLPDGRFHVIFCDVGQGDGILMKSPSGKIFVLDGGPNDSISGCLSRYVPVWDHTISLMLLSHPHADHFVGLIGLLKRFTVSQFASEDLSNSASAYQALQETINKRQVTKHLLFAGDKIHTKDGITFQILGPTKAFLASTNPSNNISDSSEFASLILYVTFGNSTILFPGDTQALEFTQAISGISGVDILQTPHHGSSTGLTAEIVRQLHPSFAVISVGAHNRYGHPSEQALKILGDQDIKILRTDQHGDIELVSDGKRWVLK